MIFFFGGRKRSVTSANAGPRHCGKCRKNTPHRLVATTEASNLYGIETTSSTDEVLMCANCGTRSKSSKDAWLRVQRSPRRHRRFRRAMTRGRSRGLQELRDSYGAHTQIDLHWIDRHEQEINRIFMSSLIRQLKMAGLGLDERDVEPHLGVFVEQMKNDLRAFVRANPD